MPTEPTFTADFEIGPRAIDAYSRLNYTMWNAFAEFIDNSTQSRLNYDSIIDGVLKAEGRPLTVEIDHNRPKKELTIKDNSIGMTKEDLVAALKVAFPTKDSRGRSKYGMGMKTAACWIGRKWLVTTCEWGSGEEWTATVDVEAIAHRGAKIPLTKRAVGKDDHYTIVHITSLNRSIRPTTEETIRGYLGSMYRFDILEGRLKLLYNGEEVKAPDDHLFDTDPEGKPMRTDLAPRIINGKVVKGWFGVLRKGGGGRRFGGFSLFQNKRQIQGYPNAWKPKSIYGGVDDEGANNLISQRLMGVIDLDGFEVSHTKDAVLFQGDEEEELEKFLFESTKDYRDYAQKRRGERGQPWTRDKIRDLLESSRREFSSPEMKDALANAILPPLETILGNNRQQLASLADSDRVATIDVARELRVVVSVSEKSEYEPHLTIVSDANPGIIHVIINRLHPYYSSLESTDAVNECLRQYVYDAIAEYRVSKLAGRVNPDSVRRLKNDLLRVQVVSIENAAESAQEREARAITGDKGPEK